jgi:hypothetical protein
MTTYDDNLLAARFSALAPEPQPGDWDDVLGRASVARGGGRSVRPRVGRRRRLLIVFAVVALVVGTASAFALRAALKDDRPDLPPVSAKPSAPASGTLVLSYFQEPPRHHVFVYADGRVVWSAHNSPYSAGGIRTGFLERRLTKEGVERLRQSVLSTVPYARRREATVIATRNLSHGVVQVRTGGRLVTVQWCCPPWPWSPAPPSWVVATKAQTRAISQLTALLADPRSGLPRSAWKDPKLRAYMPSRYAICGPRALAWLPPAARALLRGKARTYQGPAWLIRPRPRPMSCPELTTREARALEEILSANGFERHTAPGVVWAKAGTGPVGADADAALVRLVPVLPHGQLE